jgi:hypothetical protein
MEVEIGLAPREFTLSQNYPNPFNPSTTIEFTIPEDGRVRLDIYDMKGQMVAALVNEERRAGVYHQVVFNAGSLSTGTYIAHLQFGGTATLRKLLLIK